MKNSNNTGKITSNKSVKHALIVIGMHRSGTSATTGALQCLGIQLGSKLYQGHQNINEKGYFEHSDIADTNEEALLALGSTWDDVLLKPDLWWQSEKLKPYAARIKYFIQRDFQHAKLWAVKDPRVSRLLPWWLSILQDEGISPYFVFVLRSPQAVYCSLKKRDGFSREKAFLLWTLHYLEAENYSRDFPRTFIDFDQFIEAPHAQLARVSQQLNLSFPVSLTEAKPCLNQHLSKGLRHHANTPCNYKSDNSIIDLTMRVYQTLFACTLSGHAALDYRLMAHFRDEIEHLQSDYPPFLIEQLIRLGVQNGSKQLGINRLIKSWSWGVGKPIRYLERCIGRDI